MTEELKKCKLCGREFKRLGPHLRQAHNMTKEQFKEYYDMYEKEESEGICKECGAPTLFMDLTKGYRQFCSPQCSNSNESKKQKSIETNLRKYGVEHATQSKEIQDKIKQTNLDRYGVEYATQSEEIQDRIKKTNLEKYGYESPLSSPEIRDKITETNLERYGVENVFQSEEIKDRIKKTNLEIYGMEYFFQTDLFEEKSKKTNLEKYGVEYATQSKEIQDKIKQTNLDKYGVESVFQLESVRNKANERAKAEGKEFWVQTDEFKEKSKKTSREKYGTDSPMQSEEVKEIVKQTNLETYGVEWALMSPEVREEGKKTNLDKYGVEHAPASKEVRNKIIQTTLDRYGVECILSDPSFRAKAAQTTKERYGSGIFSQSHIENLEDWINIEDFLCNNKQKFTTLDLAEYFNLTHKSVRSRLIKLGLQDLMIDFYSLSMPELAFKKEIEKNIPGIRFTMHDRQVIPPLEVDFYFPDYGLAVEISPTYTHQYREMATPGIENKDYHYDKFKSCEEHGIELITVFDWEDDTKVLELIKNRLFKSEERVYARKCQVNYVDSITKDHKEFLDKNHVLGRINNKKDSFTLELIHEDEVLGLAVFYPYKDNQLELKRLAFKDGVTVVGGASKLVKNATKYRDNTEKIVTFSDNNLGTGSVYKTIGFDLVEDNKHSLVFHNIKYDWVIKDTSLWMVGADRLLKNFPGYESVGIGEDLPRNDEIVMSYGFLPVYDCGYRKWELDLNR